MMIAEWSTNSGNVCLFRETNALSFSIEGRTGTRTRFKPLPYNHDYAVNLVLMFQRTIGANLEDVGANPSSFIPLLLKEKERQGGLKVHVALFGHVAALRGESRGQLRGLRWGVAYSSSRGEQTLPVEDKCTSEYVRWAPHVNVPQEEPLISQERCTQYTDQFTLTISPHISGDIQQIALRYQLNGRSCEDILADYLLHLNEVDLQVLSFSGLAPHQIAAQCTDEEWIYFRSLIEQLDRRPVEEQKKIFMNLENQYSTLFPTLLGEIIQRRDRQIVDDGYSSILTDLKKQVIGQGYAVEVITTALANLKANFHDDAKKKQPAFLFVGPTGIGKTELAKAAALQIGNRFVRFDMEQFKEEFASTKLFGSAAGYVGSTDQPLFAKELEKYASPLIKGGPLLERTVKNTLILFDELEKAHSQVKQALLTLLDEGYCKVQYTDDRKNLAITYIFQRCVFIGTSNLYKETIIREFTQGILPEEIGKHFVDWNQRLALPQSYSQELLGRFKVLPFSPIPRGEVYQNLISVKLPFLLKDLQNSVRCLSITVDKKDLPEVVRILEEKHYGDGTGIRKIGQYFEFDVATAIHKQIRSWGNLEDKSLTIFPLNAHNLGIKCVREIFGKSISQDYLVAAI